MTETDKIMYTSAFSECLSQTAAIELINRVYFTGVAYVKEELKCMSMGRANGYQFENVIKCILNNKDNLKRWKMENGIISKNKEFLSESCGQMYESYVSIIDGFDNINEITFDEITAKGISPTNTSNDNISDIWVSMKENGLTVYEFGLSVKNTLEYKCSVGTVTKSKQLDEVLDISEDDKRIWEEYLDCNGMKKMQEKYPGDIERLYEIIPYCLKTLVMYTAYGFGKKGLERREQKADIVYVYSVSPRFCFAVPSYELQSILNSCTNAKDILNIADVGKQTEDKTSASKLNVVNLNRIIKNINKRPHDFRKLVALRKQ